MKIKRTAARVVAAIALAGIGLATAACEGGGSTATPQTVTVTEDKASSAPQTEDSEDRGEKPSDNGGATEAGATLPADWPDDDFPLPPGVTVQVQNAAERGFVLTGVDPNEVVEFYRDALPAAGYEVTTDKGVSVGGLDITGMRFSGHGYRGKIAVVSNTVAISLDR